MLTLNATANPAVFTGGLDAQTQSSVIISGTVRTTDTDMTLGAVMLGTDSTLNPGSGTIQIGSLNGGSHNLTIDGTGPTTVAGAVTSLGDGTGPALTVTSTGLVTFQDTFGAASGISASSGSIRFQGNVTLGDGDTGTTIGATTFAGGLTSFSGYDNIDLGNLTLDTTSTTATVISNNSKITLGTVNSTTPNTLTLTAGTGEVVFDGNVGSVAALSALAVTADSVTFNGSVTTTGSSGIEINAMTITASPSPPVKTLTATGSSNIEFTVANLDLNGATIDPDGGQFIINQKVTGTIEFGPTNLVSPFRDVWINPNFVIGSFSLNGGSDIYIATEGPVSVGYDLTLIAAGDMYLSYLNTAPTSHGYTSTDKDLALNATSITLGADISLGTGVFSTNSPVTLTAADVAITAAGITLGGTVGGATSGNNNLLLDVSAASGNTISVTGPVGDNITPLGDIKVYSINATAGAVTFTGAVTAKSYTQTGAGGTGGAGSTLFNGPQDYTGAFTFTGTNLAVNNTLTTGGVVTVNNDGAFATTPAGIISAGDGFSQTTSAGTVNLAGNITTTNTNASISFTDDVELTGNVEMNSSAGNGDITLSAGVTSTTARSLTLDAGTGAVNADGFLGSSASQLGAVNITGAAITTNGIYSNSKTEITNSGLFTSNAAIVSAGGFGQLAVSTGSSTLKADITTTNTLITFVQAVTIDASVTTLTLDTGGGNIALTSVTGSGKNLTLIAGTGNIGVSGPVGAGAALGAIKVASATNVTFEDGILAVSFDQSDAAGTGSGGSGFTQFDGAQNYTEGFKFIGTNLTVNNILATDTAAPGGDGAILITNASNDVNFTVGSSGSIEPGGSGGTITVDGNTTNDGTITAADITSGTPVIVNGVNYYKVIDFNGNYTSTGTLIGASSTTDDQLIVFRGDAAFGAFTHNGDTVQFSTSTGLVSTHTLDRVGDVELADVVIDDNNTVTISSGRWYIGTSPGSSWYMLSNPSPSSTGDSNYINPGRLFSSGFAGLDGKLTMGDGATLKTHDFYTRITEFTLTAPSGTSEMCFIEASGNVTINETFTNTANTDGIHSTLTMTGNGTELAVRSTQPTGTPLPPRVPEVDLGNFVVNGGIVANPVKFNSNLVFIGNVTIYTGATLSAGNNYIHMAGNETSGSTWAIEGTFQEGTSTVEFGKKSDLPLGPPGNGRIFTIGSEGRSNWYNFVCHEPMATLKFSSWVSAVSEHKVIHNIEVTPQNANGDPNIISGITPNYLILLTKDGSTPTPPAVPGGYTPPDTPNSDFWYFNLESNAMMYMHFVYIQYSFSKNRIPLPLTSQTIIVATPYVYVPEPPASPVPNYTLGTPRLDSDLATPGLDPWPETAERSYYNVNWLVNDRFLYSFTEDWNGNGRIDRIRAQAAFDIDEDVSGFEAVVEGYTVTGYTRADKDTHTPPSSAAAAARMMDMLYIYVEEKDYSDTGARPVWWVKENNSVKDNTTRSMNMKLPYEERLTANDNVPPRINYALTLPDAKFTRLSVFSGTDLGEIYVQFSEPVDTTVPMNVSSIAGAAVASDGIKPLNPSDKTEFIIPLASPYSINNLILPPSFVLDRLQDNAEYAPDKRSDPEQSYAYQYPSPKYPTDWTYSDYVEVRGDPLQTPASKPFDTVPPGGTVPETVPRWDATTTVNNDTGNKHELVGPHTVSHRVTDLQISVPPTDLSTDNQYFAWPLWAMYDPSLYPTLSGSLGDYVSWNNGYVGPGSWYNDRDIIWDFTGRRSLEASSVDGQNYDVTMQVRINILSPLPAPDRLVYSFNVSDEYKGRSRTNGTGHGSPGFWLPEPASAPPVTPSPYVNIAPLFLPPARLQPPLPVTVVSPLLNYKFSHSSNPAYDNKTGIEFYFHLTGSPPDLLAGRLEMDAGGSIPLDWYYRVRPFSFGIHNITRQRNTATILNNVINPTTGERVYLDYDLQKSGRVTIQVFTLDGNLVKVLERRSQQAGKYRVSWDGRNNGGRIVARGMYFIRIVGPDIDEIRKVMVIK
jgi:hypothetical protein